MATVSRTRTVAAPPQAVWAALADFGAISSWADTVDHSCLLSPAADGIGIGAARRVQIGRDTLVETITEFDPPRALAYDVTGVPRRLHVGNRWSLTPASDTTAVTLTSTVDIGDTPLGRLAERIVGRVAASRLVAKQQEALLADLAARVEGST